MDKRNLLSTSIEKRLEDVTDRIVEAFEPQQIILFGSFAFGCPTPDSDVDLLVIMESTERPAKRAARISRLLRPRPFPMDIIVRTPDEIHHRLNIGDPFIHDIIKRGRVLYERGISTGMGT